MVLSQGLTDLKGSGRGVVHRELGTGEQWYLARALGSERHRERHREQERGGTQRAWNRSGVVFSQGLTDLNSTGC